MFQYSVRNRRGLSWIPIYTLQEKHLKLAELDEDLPDWNPQRKSDKMLLHIHRMQATYATAKKAGPTALEEIDARQDESFNEIADPGAGDDSEVTDEQDDEEDSSNEEDEVCSHMMDDVVAGWLCV